MRIEIVRPTYPAVFGGIGFHNSEAGMYRLMSERFFSEKIAKCYRELRPGFMRCFGGFSDWTQEAMDDFAAYYGQMQQVTDTPIYMTPGRGKLHFSDGEIAQYANEVADRLCYLTGTKGVRHLRYYCFSNELGQVSMGRLKNRLELFKQYHEQLYRAFQNHGLQIGLLATDEPNDWRSIDWAMEHMDVITKDYCGHYYQTRYQPEDPAMYEDWYALCKTYADKASRCDKRFILGEYGASRQNLTILGASAKDVCSYFENPEGNAPMLGVMQAEMVIAAVNAGVFALGFWTFCDYPDPVDGPSFCSPYMTQWTKYEPFLGGGINHRYNRWGLLPFENHFNETPRPLYWCLGPIIRHLRRNSRVLSVTQPDPLVHTCAIMNDDGSLSIIISSREESPQEVTLLLPIKAGRLRAYEYRESAPPVNPFGDLQSPCATPEAINGELHYTLPPASVTVLTTDYREKAEPVLCPIIEQKNGRICWAPSPDPAHTYYRVFCGKRQLCSTVACSCRVPENGDNYIVYSVDAYGNM